MQCERCSNQIEQERVEVLPGSGCAQNRDKNRPKPIATASKGTAMELVMIDPENKEAVRQAKRVHMRSR